MRTVFVAIVTTLITSSLLVLFQTPSDLVDLPKEVIASDDRRVSDDSKTVSAPAVEQENMEGSNYDAIFVEEFELNRKSEDTRIYISEKLGIGFTYVLFDGQVIKEDGNSIWFDFAEYEDEEKHVEVYEFDKKLSHHEAIKELFLEGYDSQCYLEVGDSKVYPSGYVKTSISHPNFYTQISEERPDPWYWTAEDFCPAKYVFGHFLYNENIPGKIIYARPGTQDWVAFDGAGKSFAGSIRILK